MRFYYGCPGAKRFQDCRETGKSRGNFWVGNKPLFSSSVSKNGEVYAPETSFMMEIETSVHIKNMWIKQLCNNKVPDFAMTSRARKVSGVWAAVTTKNTNNTNSLE